MRSFVSLCSGQGTFSKRLVSGFQRTLSPVGKYPSARLTKVGRAPRAPRLASSSNRIRQSARTCRVGSLPSRSGTSRYFSQCPSRADMLFIMQAPDGAHRMSSSRSGGIGSSFSAARCSRSKHARSRHSLRPTLTSSSAVRVPRWGICVRSSQPAEERGPYCEHRIGAVSGRDVALDEAVAPVLVPFFVISLDVVEELRARGYREVVVERLPHCVVVLDGLPRLRVQSREERSEFVCPVLRPSLWLLPRVVDDAVLGEQFVDREVLFERDEELERLFDAGISCPDGEPLLGQSHVGEDFDPGGLACVAFVHLRIGGLQAQGDDNLCVVVNGHGECRSSWVPGGSEVWAMP